MANVLTHLAAIAITMFLGGAFLSLGNKAFDTMEPFYIVTSLALLVIVIGGALLLDADHRRNRAP